MTALPIANAYRNAVNQGVAKQAVEDMRQFQAEQPGGAAETTLTIAGGTVTPTLGEHAIDTEAAAALDDLDFLALANRPDGALLLIRAANAAHVVRLRHNIAGDGKLLLKGGINCRLETTDAWMLLKRTGLTWEEVFRSLGGWRERLTGNRTYYIRTDGNDANDGRENTAAGAWLTFNKAWNFIRDNLDLGGFAVTVQVADGTYTVGLLASGAIVGQKTADQVVFQGNNGAPANVLVNVAGGYPLFAEQGAKITFKDMELRTSTSGECIYATDAGTMVRHSNLRFGVCAGGAQIFSTGYATVAATGNYAITGAAARHWFAAYGGTIQAIGRTITITGTPAYSSQFACASDAGLISAISNTYSGSATGTRYLASVNGVIDTAGAGATALPGNAAGSTATGGQYV